MSGSWLIVGVDCATQEERMGLARGRLHEDGTLRVDRVTLGTAGESATATIAQWIVHEPSYLVAMDAPLGWPKRLGHALSAHVAGGPIDAEADALFRRATDQLVHRRLGKLPLEVGADRIARTARAALALLGQLRARTGLQVPLAWKQAHDSGAIEVYPAATLITRGLRSTGYKGTTSEARGIRGTILARIEDEAELAVSYDVMIEDANQLDAALCVLAGADFARGLCVEPEDGKLARKEGFIWFRGTGQRDLPY